MGMTEQVTRRVENTPDLVGALLSAKQWLTFTSGSPLQPAIAHALDAEGAWVP